MDRREVLTSATLGAMGAALASRVTPSYGAGIVRGKPLQPPANGGRISVAVLLSENAQVIDFAGPWEVFEGAHAPPPAGAGNEMFMPFELFTVAPTKDPIRATGGLRIVPDYTFADAPQAKVVVVPAQGGLAAHVDAAKEWLVKASAQSDVTMSVCTGAFILGYAGLLDGQSATTYFHRLDQFAKTFPKVNLVRGVRFVENEKISTSAGLSAGIDLALRVVERYYGREVAASTATNLEYEGKGWMV
jgi:transcriptional regulator GlxA family with amidase domain